MIKVIKTVSESDYFASTFSKLLKENVIEQLNSKPPEVDSHLTEKEKSYLLKAADVLSFSREYKELDKSLRICQHIISSARSNHAQKDKAVFILSRLGNKPLIKLAQDKNLINYLGEDRLDEILINQRIKSQTSFTLSNGESFFGNPFQLSFMEKSANADVISVSAPTAAGKSYVFCKKILDISITNQEANILYLVPTRALVTQVSQDIERELKGKVNSYEVITLPHSSFIGDSKIKIFVFTQERLHFLLSKSANKDFYYIFVDEAHKLSDSYRGILLQHAIIKATSEVTKIIYASPFSQNPEKLLELHNNKKIKESLYTPVATVNQNLYWLIQAKRLPKEWIISHISDKELEVGRLTLVSTPTTQLKRLAYLAFSLGFDSSGNVIYVNIPSDAEKAASLIVDQFKEIGFPESSDSELIDLIDLCEKTIHKKFALIQYLKFGVAFHYGNMPQILRNKIENLFSVGKIRYLICTSTLVEGVNLSCRNIFIRGPRKGRNSDRAMSREDFWNLAGRAGRWGKEFQGNVFCIDVFDEKLWPNGAPKSRTPYNIKLSVENQISNIDSVLEYLSNDMPLDFEGERENLNHLVSYLITGFQRDKYFLQKINFLSENEKKQLEFEVKRILENIDIPISLIEANPGVSPFAIKKLYDYFAQKSESEIVDLLVPESSSDDAVSGMVKVLSRINSTLAPNAFGHNSKAEFVIALLLVKWMNGYSVARIINDREKHFTKKGKSYHIAAMIRAVLDDIERVARFLAPKFISCYNDVLKYYCSQIGKDELVSQMSDVQLSLEFGVNVTTQLSLISLGLSRSTAISISEYMTNSDMQPQEALLWLTQNSIENLELPNLIKLEVLELLKGSRLRK